MQLMNSCASIVPKDILSRENFVDEQFNGKSPVVSIWFFTFNIYLFA